MKINSKSVLFAIFVIFMLTVSVATIYAEDVTVGSLTIEVPDGLTVEKKTDSSVTFKNSENCEILFDVDIYDEVLAQDYLSSKGYTFDTVNSYDKTITNADGSSVAFSYDELAFSGSSGEAYVYLLDKDGQGYTVIAFPDPSTPDEDVFGSGTPFEFSSDAEGISELINAIMGV